MAEGAAILVIDDEPQIRRFLRVSLEAHGFRILEATSGQEGLRPAALEKPDLLVLALGLPDMDGHAALGRPRAWTNLPGTFRPGPALPSPPPPAPESGTPDLAPH